MVDTHSLFSSDCTNFRVSASCGVLDREDVFSKQTSLMMVIPSRVTQGKREYFLSEVVDFQYQSSLVFNLLDPYAPTIRNRLVNSLNSVDKRLGIPPLESSNAGVVIAVDQSVSKCSLPDAKAVVIQWMTILHKGEIVDHKENLAVVNKCLVAFRTVYFGVIAEEGCTACHRYFLLCSRCRCERSFPTAWVWARYLQRAAV